MDSQQSSAMEYEDGAVSNFVIHFSAPKKIVKKSLLQKNKKLLQKNKNTKNKKNKNIKINLSQLVLGSHSILLERTLETFKCVEKGMPIEHGPTKPGHIRFFKNPFESHGFTIFSCIVMAHERKLSEWNTLIKEWESYGSSGFQTVNSCGLSWAAAATILREALEKELRWHWIARKFVTRLRIRAYNRHRTVGLQEDLYTLSPIPPNKLVKILDYTSRSMYCFHVHTILQTIRSALYYSTYGIALPQLPKNPYTNLVWSRVQLMSVTEQIGAIYWNSHSKIPKEIIALRACDYTLHKFTEKHKYALSINAAVSFFKNHDSPDVKEIYQDILQDLYDDCAVEGRTVYGFKTIKPLVVFRKLKKELMDRWDKMITSAWIYENHNLLHEIKNYEELLSSFELVLSDSMSWWRMQPRPMPAVQARMRSVLHGAPNVISHA